MAESGGPLEDLKKYLDFLGVEPGDQALRLFVALLVLGLVVAALRPLVPAVHELWNVVRWAAGRRLGDERRRRRRRRLFAQHLDIRLKHLELQEDWRDEKYAELEAEVEVEQSRRRRWVRRLVPLRGPGLRRVRSLSQALARSSEPLVLLEGEPGAGKSVALRHLARLMAQDAANSKSIKATIPLYLNLKQLDVRPEDVTAEHIRQFVLDFLNEANSRDVQEVLDTEFQRGLEEGTWLFLFDSFDEIPDILSAEDTRRVAPAYARAIADFLGPFGECRGIVASRDFSSPDIARFTRFRILRLSPRQQQRLITRADLDRRVDRAMRHGLATASQDIATFAGNPMFLSLLCEHMRNNADFPTGSHTVFEDYLTQRLRRDAARIRARFGVEVGLVRAGAEEVAFVMASVPRMGLTPTRADLLAAATGQERVSPRLWGTLLNALEYSKLGRSDTNLAGEPTFSFVHRRFQEYFATCVVINSPRRASVESLLDNDQWRETAVTLLQVQHGAATAPLLDLARRRLAEHAQQARDDGFRWPPGCLHLLGVLATGLETHPDEVDDASRAHVGQILERAWESGNRLDKRRAVAFANLAPPAHTERLLVDAFRSRNEYLREAAFRTAGSIPGLSAELRRQIRLALLGLVAGFRVYRRRAATVAQIKRLARPAEFLRLVNLVSFAVPVAVLFTLGGLLTISIATTLTADAQTAVGGVIVTGFLLIGLTATVLGIFSTSALGTTRVRLEEVLSRSERLERILLKEAAFAVLVLVNTACCLLSTMIVSGALDGSFLLWAVFFAFGSLWPLAVVWVVRFGFIPSVVWWPLLPVALVVVGGYRLPSWCGRRARLVRAEWRDARSDLARTVRRAARQAVRHLVMPLMAIGAVLVLGIISVNVSGVEEMAMVATFVVGAGLAPIPVLSVLNLIAVRRLADRARSVEDVLTVIARAWTNPALDAVVARFAFHRVTRDPSVGTALETLIGEIERSQGRGGPRLPLGRVCASLRRWHVPPPRLTGMAFYRDFLVLSPQEVREECLDDLARLIDSE